jgi:hypothetical protein
MSIIIIVGIYSNKIVHFSIKSHLLQQAHADIVVLLLRRLDGYEARGDV